LSEFVVRGFHCAMQNTLKTDQFCIRIDPVIRAQLEAAAVADRRPLSNLVRIALTDWLASHDGGSA
jgi:hypothetical protein